MIQLDNGRTKVPADKVGRAALHCIRCIRCSVCLSAAARVYIRTGGHAHIGFRPIYIGTAGSRRYPW